MNPRTVEVLVGALVATATVYLIFLAIRLGAGIVGDSGYILYADFASVSGLQTGDPVKIAGVKIGEVESITLADYQARVTFRILNRATIYENAVASIKTEGLIGDRSVSIDPGSSRNSLGPGERIAQTQSTESLQYLLGRWIAGDVSSGG